MLSQKADQFTIHEAPNMAAEVWIAVNLSAE